MESLLIESSLTISRKAHNSKLYVFVLALCLAFIWTVALDFETLKKVKGSIPYELGQGYLQMSQVAKSSLVTNSTFKRALQ